MERVEEFSCADLPPDERGVRCSCRRAVPAGKLMAFALYQGLQAKSGRAFTSREAS
jgi:hypothetical protein